MRYISMISFLNFLQLNTFLEFVSEAAVLHLENTKVILDLMFALSVRMLRIITANVFSSDDPFAELALHTGVLAIGFEVML